MKTIDFLRRNLCLGAVSAAAALALTINPTLAADPIVMKVGMVTINDPIHDFSTRFAEEVTKRSGGRIKGEVYPAGQLGKAARQIENLQFGTQEVFVSPPGFLAGINPAFTTADAPGVFRDIPHAHAVITQPTFRAHYLDLAKSRGIIGASIWAYGPTAIATSKPVKSVDQLKGLKVRILASEIERATVEAMGMSGVPMDFTETLQAIQNGTIDGTRTSMVVMGGMKFQNTVKNVLRDNTGIIFTGAWVSKAWFDKLPKDLQQVVLDVGKDLDAFGTKISEDYEQTTEKEWLAANVTITRLDAAQQKELFDRVSGIGPKLMAGNQRTAETWKMLQAALAAAK